MNKNNLFKAAVLACTLVATTGAYADDDHDSDAINTGLINPCQNLQLVNTLITPGNPANTTVCVDVPVNLTRTKVVFNLDSLATANGAANGIPVGLRHMWMLGTAIKDRIDRGLMDPSKVSIIGIFHGSSAVWGLSDDWWTANKGTAGNPNKVWIERLFALKNAGVNIQLEICGVTMFGNGWSNVITPTHPTSDVYSSINGSIHVNQGAIGRLIDLEQHGYTYIQEGFVDSPN